MFNLTGLMGSGLSAGQTNGINNNILPVAQYTEATDATSTLAVSKVAGSHIVILSETPGAAVSLTFPTAAAIIAAVPQLATGESYFLRVVNKGTVANTITMITNTGLTLTGTMTLAVTSFRDFIVTLTSTTAVTITSAGTGTTS